MSESTSTGTFTLIALTARRFDKVGAFYAKVRLGEQEIRTDPTKLPKAASPLPLSSEFSLQCNASDLVKLSIYRTREEKKAELVGSGAVEAYLFHKDSQLRIKLKSKHYPSSTVNIQAKFEPKNPISSPSRKLNLASKSRNSSHSNNNNNIPDYSIYDPLIEMFVEKELELVNAVCETSSYLDLDDISIAFVYLFYSQGKILDVIKWAIRKELKNTDKEELLFRGQSVNIKMMSDFATLVGRSYLSDTLKPIILEMHALSSEQPISFEVNPNRVEHNLEENRNRIKSFSLKFLQTISSSEEQLPSSIREVCRQLHRLVKKRFPNSADIVLGGFLFLRFICPAIVAPEQSQLLSSQPNMNFRRGLVLCAKLLQNLASGVTFGEKESYMEEFNSFIHENMDSMLNFFSLVRKKTNVELKEEVTIGKDDLHKHMIRLHTYLIEHHGEIEQHLKNETAEKLAKVVSELGLPPSPSEDHLSPRATELQRNRSTFFTRFQSIFRS